eukprot:2170917-Rhodomonas_salina.1
MQRPPSPLRLLLLLSGPRSPRRESFVSCRGVGRKGARQGSWSEGRKRGARSAAKSKGKRNGAGTNSTEKAIDLARARGGGRAGSCLCWEWQLGLQM